MSPPTATTHPVAAAVKSALKFTPRRSATRGHANHGWLKSYHTFSFANYQNSMFDQWGPLRVINEDRVEPNQGFGQHSHREFEIWSYIVEGELEHRDSMGNLEIMKRGDVQMTSTGTGIAHSEYNRNPSKPVHFLQIWGLPSQSRLAPTYYNRHFTDKEKYNQLVRIVAPLTAEGVSSERDAKGPTPIHASITMHASILSSKNSISHTLLPDTTKAYLHLIMRSGYRSPNQTAADKFEDGGAMLKVNEGLILEEGDGTFVTLSKEGDRTLHVSNAAERDAEWLLFEMA